ncbi:MAG: hypothetical protein K2X53_02230, partial [Alphaproteobacteria bacterium]|nr:hypothetical protein [Alphaproteobacteria bacterium]
MVFNKSSLRLLSSAAVLWTLLAAPSPALASHSSSSPEIERLYEERTKNYSMINDDAAFKEYFPTFTLSKVKAGFGITSTTKSISYVKASGVEKALNDFLQISQHHYQVDPGSGRNFMKSIQGIASKTSPKDTDLLSVLTIKDMFDGDQKDFAFMHTPYFSALCDHLKSVKAFTAFKKYLKDNFKETLFDGVESPVVRKETSSLSAQPSVSSPLLKKTTTHTPVQSDDDIVESFLSTSGPDKIANTSPSIPKTTERLEEEQSRARIIQEQLEKLRAEKEEVIKESQHLGAQLKTLTSTLKSSNQEVLALTENLEKKSETLRQAEEKI